MRMNKFVFTSATILSLAIVFTAFATMNSPIPSVYATSRQVMLKGSFASGWNGTNPGPTITVSQGDTLTVNLVSVDGAPHTFVVDVAKAGIVVNPNCSVDKCSSQFTSSTSFMFTADMPAGTYTYYCSIHLKHMYGTLTVQAGQGTGTGAGSTTTTPPTTNPTSNTPAYTSSSGTVLIVAAIVIALAGVGATVVLLARRKPTS